MTNFPFIEQLSQSKDYDFTETSFKFLMQNRIYRVLVVCSNYDFYMLEEDGRIDEQIFAEYVSLNLRYPPIFIQANTVQKAFRILREQEIDLVIIMLSVGNFSAFEISHEIKNYFSEKPIVVLTPFLRDLSLRLEDEDVSHIDYIFSWLGHTEILLAIIKLIEDKKNVEHDVKEIGVQVILLVEDSIRFYSSYLPNMYKIIFKQSRSFMTEGLNDHKEMMRLRGRPKILLATTYNEALDYYEKYKDNMLGIISDIRYDRDGKNDPEAGFRLASVVQTDDSNMPFVLQSSELRNREKARERGITFLYKYSKTLSLELRDYIFRNMAFGDFVFRMPDGSEIARAANLQTLQRKIANIPIESLEHHFNRNDFSRWLNARALFPIASMLKYLTLSDFNSVDAARSYILKAIASYRVNKGRGVIAKFEKETYDKYLIFSRVGDGSLGGKARGLAFIDSFLKRNKTCHKFSDVIITIPRTVVLSTDVFDEFIESNRLYRVGMSDELSDEQILEEFVAAHFPAKVLEKLEVFLSIVRNPIAVRSSSLLEDSHYQPFAGIYSTYMIPNVENDKKRMQRLLTDAIKSVYASVFYKSSKAYMEATSNVIDEEKMAIILQEVCGKRHGNMFYPTFSGVARSINFYPIAPEKSEDGIAKVALGLGKITVEGGITLRFSPKYPKKILQLSTPELAVRETQKEFYALDLDPDSFNPSTDDSMNFFKHKIRVAQKHRAINFLSSTYDFENHIIRDGTGHKGKKIITFSNILNHGTFPLAEILQALLKVGQKEMNNPIEIEFAVELDVPKGMPRIFNFLQIRPIVENTENVNFDLKKTHRDDLIIYSSKALGNGLVDDVHDFVYVKPDAFNAAHSKTIAQQVEKVNEKFVAQKKNYILVGPGRWGSSDPWLGVPVKWSQISAARLIVESGLKNYRIDPSQGTHFFQNLTSFRVGYFTINPFENDGYYDLDFLNAAPAEFEDQYIRQVHFEKPLIIKIDGKNNLGVVFKPEMASGENKKQ